MSRPVRSFEAANQRLKSTMSKVDNMTDDQLRAAGWKPPAAGDYDVNEEQLQPTLEQQAQAMYEQAVPQPEVPQNQNGGLHAPLNPPMYHQPYEPSDPAQMMGVIISQNQQLMAENAQLRQQLMQLVQAMQQLTSQPQAPQHRQVPRAENLSSSRQQQIAESPAGLLG